MSATAVSTRRGEDDVVITNLVVIKFGGKGAGWRYDLCVCQTSLRGGKERTATSRRSSLLMSPCILDLSGLDFPGSS